MPSERLSAVAGTAATLESRAVTDRAASTGPVVHRLRNIFGIAPDLAGVCDGCGLRIDAASVAELKELHRQHAIDERHRLERERAAVVTPDRVAAIKADVQRIAGQKGGTA